MTRIRYARRLRLECLESRDAPARVISGTQVGYRDVDGDLVTITFTKSFLTNSNFSSVFDFVDDQGGQQLQKIDLTGVGAAAAGTSIATQATRHPLSGDGLATLGYINAMGIDLGAVTIDGDLGRIMAGDTTTTTSGLKGLTTQSMGRFGTSTGAPDLKSKVQGKLDFLKVKSDMKEVNFLVQGGVDGKLGSLFIGGSLIGGAGDTSGRIISQGDMGGVTVAGNLTGAGGNFSGEVFSSGRLAGVKIGGSVQGGGGIYSGGIYSAGDMGFVTIKGNLTGGGGNGSGKVDTDGKLAGVKIGGSVQGGPLDFSGRISSEGDMGIVTIKGNLAGGGGKESGELSSSGKLAGVRIGGSVQGGGGFRSGGIRSDGHMGFVTILGNLTSTVSCSSNLAGVKIGGSVQGGPGGVGGQILSNGSMGSVTIQGNLAGASDEESGEVFAFGELAGVKIGGSVLGGAGSRSGRIFSARGAGTIVVGGDVVGGSALGTASLSESGFIHVKRIGNLSIGGSLIAGTRTTSSTFVNNGAVRVDDDLGTVLIKGSIIGNATNLAIISARGQAVPTATTDVAIGSLRVLGRVEFARILAGVDYNGAAKNADAQIGTVSVGGDWIASSMAAGAVPGALGFGEGDSKMSGAGVKDEAAISSKITRVTIGGQAMGTVSGTDHHGIVSESVDALKVAGVTFPTTAGKDDFPIGITGDFTVKEL
jgi:hypothetical protein